MTMFKRLQAAIACSEAPYKAIPTRALSGVPYRYVGKIPTELRGLWCLIQAMNIELEEIRNSIRRRQLGCEPNEPVRDDHDH